ncbi:hypothetical protein LCGC14_1673220 [marine sediment metagenome]|uniref:Uncharacterized protein n=1 Tax=marine sediment metagenome TaxID=412755 RepID=A0A0F9ID52_9ZZZZ
MPSSVLIPRRRINSPHARGDCAQPRRQARRKSRGPRTGAPPIGTQRPGRFFRLWKFHLQHRKRMDPHELGCSDFLLYATNLNPHRRGSWSHRHYERGYDETAIEFKGRPPTLAHFPSAAGCRRSRARAAY